MTGENRKSKAENRGGRGSFAPCTAVLKDSSRPDSEDHVDIRLFDDHVLIALADGAGGSSGGGAAAEFAVRSILEWKLALDPAEWVMCLAEIDRRLSEGGTGGEITAVAALISAETIVGASVGDSGAWFIQAAECVDLTHQQKRKPLLGSGSAVPSMIRFGAGPGILLVATDGLLKYAPRERILETARTAPLEDAPRRLIDLARMKSGGLQDDVAVALCCRST